jgi:hypothetical protein
MVFWIFLKDIFLKGGTTLAKKNIIDISPCANINTE